MSGIEWRIITSSGLGVVDWEKLAIFKNNDEHINFETMQYVGSIDISNVVCMKRGQVKRD